MIAKPNSDCFYGELVQRREAAGFILSESKYSPDTRIPKHSHDRAYFNILFNGSYLETYGSKSRACNPSTVVFHPAGETHTDHFLDNGGLLFRCEIQPEWLARFRSYSSAVDLSAHFYGGSLAWLVTRLYHEFRQMDHLSSLMVEGLALEIVAEAFRHSERSAGPRPPHWLKQAIEIIRTQFSQPLTLQSVGETVGVHPFHLARVFRQFQKCTVGEYVRQLRVEYASRQLSSSELPIAEIAAAAGFADQSHLTKHFKRQTGSTPAQYRLTHKSRSRQPG